VFITAELEIIKINAARANYFSLMTQESIAICKTAQLFLDPFLSCWQNLSKKGSPNSINAILY
jgi:hypothetical protein